MWHIVLAHCAKQGLHEVAIRTVDTYVVILAVGHFNVSGIEELWVSFGTGAHFCHLPIHAFASILGVKAIPLMLFHSLTGCATATSIPGCGNRSAWLTWIACPAFPKLSPQPQLIESADREVYNCDV